jgi:nitrogenase molybdenum-iron protein NifN
MKTITYKKKYVSTTNACKLCTPMGACLAFRGIEGAVPFLHGSQGCATYMRRYIISHFNEPMDIASSSLGEKNAVFGGSNNLKLGLKNVIEKYRPQLVGIGTTCLTETIGDDVPMIIREFRHEAADTTLLPELVTVSTPSYAGTHMEGFHAAVRAVVAAVAEEGEPEEILALLPGFVSPVDLRYLKEILADFGLEAVILPDFSETLDGPALREYELVPRGGTPLAGIRRLGRAQAAIEMGRTLDQEASAASFLNERFGVRLLSLGLPIGLRETDRFCEALAELSGRKLPVRHAAERGRLIDSWVDGHKYVSGKKAVVYGEEDLVVGLTALLAEVGIQPVLCASGGKSGRLAAALEKVTGDLLPEQPLICENADFHEIFGQAEALAPDFLLGHSKGYSLARKIGIPLIRTGFPIHDRLGGQRILHFGYRGAQQLFDRITNALIAKKQDDSPVGYSYM